MSRTQLAALWTVISIVNLCVWFYTGSLLSALLSALSGGIAIAMLVGILRELL